MLIHIFPFSCNAYSLNKKFQIIFMDSKISSSLHWEKYLSFERYVFINHYNPSKLDIFSYGSLTRMGNWAPVILSTILLEMCWLTVISMTIVWIHHLCNKFYVHCTLYYRSIILFYYYYFFYNYYNYFITIILFQSKEKP